MDKSNKDNNILNNAPTNKAKQQNVHSRPFAKGKNGQPPKGKPVAGKNHLNHNVSSNNAKQFKQDNVLTHPVNTGKLKIMLLGGVGEIGKNMTVFEYGDSIVILDCGVSFPTDDMPGIDVVIPDMTYLADNKHKIKALLLTHGHEDHIGAVPFLVKKLNIKLDIFGTKLTLGLVENKLIEHNVMDKVNLVQIADKTIVTLGNFSVEFIHVSHSVAGSCAIVLRSPIGTVVHTGDFKVDYTPLGNEIMNLNRIAEVGREGVLLLMSDSTNAEKPGYTMSESVVSETLNKLFSDAKGRRIIVATFASNIDRLGVIMNLARQYKRKIAVSGRSMVKCIETAARVGHITLDKSLFVDIDKVNSIEDGKLVILSTGSQGEPMAALTRMASGEFNKVKIGSNDTIILSSSPIPGNEKDIYAVINNLYRLGAVVVYSSLADVHVSGHACQEELKLVYTLVKPRYFMPVHGEYRHLKQHSMLIEKLGHKTANIIVPDLGDLIEINNNIFKVAGKVTSGGIMVDGLGIGDIGNIVLKDRLTLAEDGILIAVIGINRVTGKIASGPEVISRGCFFSGDDSSAETIEDIKKAINIELSKLSLVNYNVSVIKNSLQRIIRQYFRVKYKRNPVVLPIILEM